MVISLIPCTAARVVYAFGLFIRTPSPLFARWQEFNSCLLSVFSMGVMVLTRESIFPFSSRVTAFQGRDGLVVDPRRRRDI
jgi:hypothetical protein